MQERSVEIDVLVAEVGPQVLASLQALLADLYIPLVAGQQAVRRQAQSAKDDFVQVGAGAGTAAGCACSGTSACAAAALKAGLLPEP